MVGEDIPAYDGLSTDLFDVERTDFKAKFSPPSYSVNSKIPFPLIFLQIGKTGLVRRPRNVHIWQRNLDINYSSSFSFHFVLIQ